MWYVRTVCTREVLNTGTCFSIRLPLCTLFKHRKSGHPFVQCGASATSQNIHRECNCKSVFSVNIQCALFLAPS